MTDRQMIEIASSDLSAAVNPFGAELTHLRDRDGRELMTDADPAFWTGHAPILFPVVGRVTGDVIRVDGTEYPMAKHGFARRSLFALAAQDTDRVTFRLSADDATRAAYPFDFILDIDFTLTGASLTIEARLRNPGDQPLPASFGFHPAFAWPLPYGEDRAAHRLTFTADEPGTLKRVTPDGFIGPDARPSPFDGSALPLRDDLFTDDALVWDPVASRALTYGATHGPGLRIDWDAPRLGVWTKPGAHYVCIEPWHGIADPEGFTGEYRDKPGVFQVAPGAIWTTKLTMTLDARTQVR